jgi:TRAP-type C4-dicarboxylate transport system permease small subunit
MPMFFLIAALAIFAHGAAFVSIQNQKEKAREKAEAAQVVAQTAPTDAPVGP